jgi:hypothetical protein
MSSNFSQDQKGPYFDRSEFSRELCKAGLVLCWLVGLLSLAVGIYFVKRGGYFLKLPQHMGEMFPLIFNTLITICNEIVGYIHTTSLRWSLSRGAQATLQFEFEAPHLCTHFKNELLVYEPVYVCLHGYDICIIVIDIYEQHPNLRIYGPYAASL